MIKEAMASIRKRSDQLRRRHHVVPRFYLERFANEGQIGIWDTTNGDLSTRGTTNTSVITDFYMVYDEVGTPSDVLEVEVLDREVEAPAAPAVSRAVETGVISDEDRKAIARFVGFQYVRGQRFPKPVEDGLVELGKLQMAQAADLIEAGYEVEGVDETIREVKGREPTQEDYKEFMEALRSREGYKYAINRSASVAKYLSLGEAAESLLHAREWQLVHFDDPLLVTADEPVWLEWDGEPGPYGEGLGTVPAVWIPLSATTALRMGRTDVGGIEPSSIEPEWLNRCVAGQAHRFLFGNPDLLGAL